MKNKLQVGQEVKSGHLGSGVVTKVIISGIDKNVFAYLVMFDKTPHVNYNGGSNPCIQFIGNLTTK